MIGFTPGPWTIRPHGKRPRAIFGATNAEPLAAVFSDGHNESKHANARLIAAAPDLLDALRYAVEEAAAHPGRRLDNSAFLILAVSAIEKATTSAYDRA